MDDQLLHNQEQALALLRELYNQAQRTQVEQTLQGDRTLMALSSLTQQLSMVTSYIQEALQHTSQLLRLTQDIYLAGQADEPQEPPGVLAKLDEVMLELHATQDLILQLEEGRRVAFP